MKSNNKINMNFVSKFKYIILIPLITALTAIVFSAVFGLNFDYDFRTVSTFDVKFNTTVSNQEYIELEKSLEKIMDTEFTDYRIEKIGEGAQNGLLVRVANDNRTFDNKIEDIKVNIESNLLDSFSNKDNTSITITTSDTSIILPKNITDLLLYSALAMICIMIFVFLYYIFRYNFVSGVSIVLTILSEIVMLTSVMIVARIPFNYYFVISYFAMIALTIFVTAYINNEIKSNLNVEKYSKYSNSDRIYDAVNRTKTSMVLFISVISLLLIALMFFGNLSLIYTIISVLSGNAITLFASLILYTTLWSFWYKKDKDNALRRRIQSEKKKLENKDDEKIVV